MKTIKVRVYTYDELNEDAKEKALGWWAEGFDGAFEWDCTKEDAENVGLVLEGTDRDRMTGHFQVSGEECAKAILKEHGPKCETYKTAKQFLKDFNRMAEPIDEDTKAHDEWEQYREECETEFLRSILEDYRTMLDKDYEYNQYGEGAIESIRANEYTFTKDGKRFG